MKKDWKYYKFLQRFKGRISLIGKEGNVATEVSVPIEKNNSQNKAYPFKSSYWKSKDSITPFSDISAHDKHFPLPIIKKQMKKSLSNFLLFNNSYTESTNLRHNNKLKFLLHRHLRAKSRNTIEQESVITKEKKSEFPIFSKKLSYPSISTYNLCDQCYTNKDISKNEREERSHMNYLPKKMDYYTQESVRKVFPLVKYKAFVNGTKKKGSKRINKSLARFLDLSEARLCGLMDEGKRVKNISVS